MGAFSAGPAEPVMHGSALGADMAEGTFPFDIEQAVIESFAHSASFFSEDVFADWCYVKKKYKFRMTFFASLIITNFIPKPPTLISAPSVQDILFHTDQAIHNRNSCVYGLYYKMFLYIQTQACMHAGNQIF